MKAMVSTENSGSRPPSRHHIYPLMLLNAPATHPARLLTLVSNKGPQSQSGCLDISAHTGDTSKGLYVTHFPFLTMPGFHSALVWHCLVPEISCEGCFVGKFNKLSPSRLPLQASAVLGTCSLQELGKHFSGSLQHWFLCVICPGSTSPHLFQQHQEIRSNPFCTAHGSLYFIQLDYLNHLNFSCLRTGRRTCTVKELYSIPLSPTLDVKRDFSVQGICTPICVLLFFFQKAAPWMGKGCDPWKAVLFGLIVLLRCLDYHRGTTLEVEMET